MSVPTDRELNEAMARVCGWERKIVQTCVPVHPRRQKSPRDRTTSWVYHEAWYGPQHPHLALPVPDFCHDRNTLPEVWQSVENANAELEYLTILMESVSNALPNTLVYRLNFARITAEPRLQVTAALKALGAWKPEWDAPATENDRAAEEMDTEQEA